MKIPYDGCKRWLRRNFEAVGLGRKPAAFDLAVFLDYVLGHDLPTDDYRQHFADAIKKHRVAAPKAKPAKKEKSTSKR